MRYVIVGNSTAATFAAENIRSLDRSGEILILSEEPFPAYGRPLISYYLQGRVSLAGMALRPARFYEENRIAVRLGVRVRSLDPAAKRVIAADGEEIAYDKLLIATGSRPFLPPIGGAERIFTFSSLGDAIALERAVGPSSRVLILGAGLIGMKCAEGLARRAGKITVVEKADRVLSSVLDGESAAAMRRRSEEEGIDLCLGDGVARIDGQTAETERGRRIPFDVFVCAAGVRPRTELVKEAGGAADRGILVDEFQRTSLPDVYAAGDNCESSDVSSGTRRVLALLPNAAAQGAVAGRNMAGGEARFTDAVPVNAVGLFGLHAVTAGTYEGESLIRRSETGYRRLFVSGGVLKGYILTGNVARAGILTSLVRNRTPLGALDGSLLEGEPTLAAFPKAAREEMLTGRR